MKTCNSCGITYMARHMHNDACDLCLANRNAEFTYIGEQQSWDGTKGVESEIDA